MIRITSIILLCILTIDAWVDINGRVHREESKRYVEWRKPMEHNEKAKKFVYYDDHLSATTTAEENIAQDRKNDRAASIARAIVNYADWSSVATISTRTDIQTFPTASVISIADGPLKNGTGIPYMYLTPLDYTARDIIKDHRATLLVSMAQGNLCQDFDLDPMSPLCPRVMLSGKIKRVDNTTQEHKYVKEFFFDRHPYLKNMPPDHEFFFAKLEIAAISMLNNFGGPKYIPVDDYLSPLVDRNIFDRSKRHYIMHLFSN